MLRLSEAFPIQVNEQYWKELVFFDIETTGFSRKYHQVGLISLAAVKNHQLEITQYFAEDSSEEGWIITAALRDINQYLAYISYNGDAFDISFLNDRAKHLRLGSRLHRGRSIDLYRLRRKDRLKQTEADSGFEREDDISGKEWADLYKNYLKTPETALRQRLLLHCRDDILSLVKLLESSDELKGIVQAKILLDPPRIIQDIIPSPTNLRIRLLDQTNQESIIDLPLIDTPNFSVLDDPTFDQLESDQKQQLVLIEQGKVMTERVQATIQKMKR